MHTLTQDPLAMAERMTAHACLPAAHETHAPALTMRERIDRLQAEMSQMPQATDCETDHYFVPGMYCRRLARKAGTVIVGKVHKAPHFFMCAAGEIIVLTENGPRTLKAGDVIESQPGTKRVTVALTDAVGITIHKTDKTDLDEIEAELIEPDETALFDARNTIKAALLSGAAELLGGVNQ